MNYFVFWHIDIILVIRLCTRRDRILEDSFRGFQPPACVANVGMTKLWPITIFAFH